MSKPIEVNEYIAQPVIPEIRKAIEDAGGNEVFFIGETDEKLIVTGVRVLARGDAESVPAVTRAASIGNVVIHNHPDGVVHPSKADLAVAADLADMGVGFYVIDNNIEKIYPVVEPTHGKELCRLDIQKLADYILPGGPVSRVLKDYEYRDEQLQMMDRVCRAFNEDRLAVIEAGTGTGKSLAYLIPAIAWSLANDERVVISTNTINLQEQLAGKDIPLLRRIGGLKCRAVLVKGRHNYLCLRKLASVEEEGQLLLDGTGRREIDTIRVWAKTTRDGSLADLGFIPKKDNWERVRAEADQCTRLHCPLYDDCFFYRARRQASAANLLIVNHHLLMADLAVRRRTGSYERPAVLPRFHRIIIDEAHRIEDVATDYFGFQISKFGIFKALRRLQATRKKGRGLLPFLKAKLTREAGESDARRVADIVRLIDKELIPARHELEKTIDAAMERIADEMRGCYGGGGGKRGLTLRIVPDVSASRFWSETLCPTLRELRKVVEPFAERIKELVGLLNGLSVAAKKQTDSPRIELGSMHLRLCYHLECLAFFVGEEEGYCRWLELRKGRRGEILRFCSAPLDVSEGMREAVYRRFGTVVMTSATLTVGGGFDYVSSRLGLEELHEGKLDKAVFPSSFDFTTQAFVGTPTGIAPPDGSGYEAMLEENVREAVAISRGRAFVLFTSYRLLDRIYNRLKGPLEEMGLEPLAQGSDTRTSLINRFRRSDNAVLFATDSFWEGVDVKGKALQCVILTRLPFRVPDEPIQQARVEAIEEAGGDPFMGYSVPQAVIKFRQGFGRLIRHRDDVGAVLILDVRVTTRRYGRLFINSLPDVSLHRLPPRRMLEEMKLFFERVRKSGT